MPVFSNYNSSASGGFLKQSKPAVHVYPWRPQQRSQPGTIRPQLAQPHERSRSFAAPTVAGSSAADLRMSTAQPGCGGGCGGCTKGCKK